MFNILIVPFALAFVVHPCSCYLYVVLLSCSVFFCVLRALHLFLIVVVVIIVLWLLFLLQTCDFVRLLLFVFGLDLLVGHVGCGGAMGPFHPILSLVVCFLVVSCGCSCCWLVPCNLLSFMLEKSRLSSRGCGVLFLLFLLSKNGSRFLILRQEDKKKRYKGYRHGHTELTDPLQLFTSDVEG